MTVFRTATVFGPNVENFLSRLMEAPRITTVRGYEPPLQLVHEDDVASAIALAVKTDLDGIYNLAADGWLSSDEVVALSGKKRVELPEAVAFSMAERLWKTGLRTAPPGELHYLMHPWVVDSSKLRAAGWTPRYSTRGRRGRACAGSSGDARCGRCDGARAARAQAHRNLSLPVAPRVAVQVTALPLEEVVGVVANADLLVLLR